MAIHLHAFVFKTDDYLRALPSPLFLSKLMLTYQHTNEKGEPDWVKDDYLQVAPPTKGDGW
ncbi:MAG: hypothetical protein L0177_01300, partial [Chloroflexi bacterium]|nr:hypothetical protein [Chloroflexota bacterium]